MGYEQPERDRDVLGCCVLRNAISRSRPDYALGRRLTFARRYLASGTKILLLMMLLGLATTAVFAVVTGSISGTARDSQGAVLPGVAVQLRNTQTGVVQTIQTDSVGFYNFPAVPLGHYDVSFQKTDFGNYSQTDVVVNVDSALRVDATMKVGANQQQVTVQSSQVHVDTENAQMGEVIGAKEMTNLPLNGRAYTDLLALQPGVVPLNVSQYGSLRPANSLSNGDLSISGARDVNSGFMVNGANTVEGNGGGTTLIPTLDSIAEFRIITSNAGAEYGNYAGGLINVVTKTGTNQFHGDAFEFFRNTNLDATQYFNPSRGVFKQNQFGGTIGGPILRDKLFFFGDYQGTRQTVGVSTGLISVPSAAERTGDFSGNTRFTGADDPTHFVPKTVNGAFWASQLSSKLGYTVVAGENYYSPGCTSSADCVFPNAQIPQTAWSPVSPHVLTLIPNANSGANFISNANPEILKDNKGSVRIDANTRFGVLSGYWHYDPFSDTNPYNPGYGGSTVPGFPNTTTGKAQLFVASDTITFNPTTVNVFTASYFRTSNVQGNTPPGPLLSTLGFASPADEGIYQLEPPQYQNWPYFGFNGNLSLGAFNSVVSQFDNTYQGQDDFTKIVRTHTLKFGADYHWDQIDITHPNNGGNGGFGFNGQETGVDIADMLIGAPNYFYQGASAGLQLRSFYLGIYGEDSWRVSSNLTVNYGIRYDVTPYWSDAHNRNPVVLLGKQSTQFPTAPEGYLFPGDAGVPIHMANIRYNNFAPRFGLAYSPDISGNDLLHAIFGDHGQSSIRAGFGMYYTNIQGANTFNFAAAPYALFYFSSAPPLFDRPFITRASGQNLGQRFPLPPVDPATIDWSAYEPISGNRNPLIDSPTPYEEHVDLSFERALTSNTILSVSYVGTFGRHLILNADQNQGDPALCLSVSQPGSTTDGNTCGPFGENGTYLPVGGGVIHGTRGPLGPNFGGNGLQLDVGNSSYHALETTLRRVGDRFSLLLSYTHSKAIDDGSGFGDQIILGRPTDFFRGLSVFDLPNNFVASYTYELPFDFIFKRDNRLTRGWKLSGITSFTSGVPVQISEPDDQSLLGNTGNSAFAGSTDEPDLAPGNIKGDHNPRHQQPYFNTSLFTQEPLGGQGTSPRRFFHGPGRDNWDMALLKDVKITSTTSAEFRVEFFNVFNHAQFNGTGSVDGNFNDGFISKGGTFGKVTSAGDPRIGQLAVKFFF